MATMALTIVDMVAFTELIGRATAAVPTTVPSPLLRGATSTRHCPVPSCEGTVRGEFPHSSTVARSIEPTSGSEAPES